MKTKRFIAAALVAGTSALGLAGPALADKWETYDVVHEVDVETNSDVDGDGVDDGGTNAPGGTHMGCAFAASIGPVSETVCEHGPEYQVSHEVTPVDGGPTVRASLDAGKTKRTGPNYKPERDDVCEPVLEETADFCFGRITPEDL